MNIDFVLSDRRSDPIAVECKWSASDFDPSNILSFRGQHPDGTNYVVANDVTGAYSRDCDGINIWFISIADLLQNLKSGTREHDANPPVVKTE